MGWSIGFDSNWQRDVGYGVPAICDHPDCSKEIDRGLAYVCGGEPYGGEKGCGLYFCSAHLAYKTNGRTIISPQLCDRCVAGENPFTPKPDSPEWVNFKMTDPSWAEWRKEQLKANG